MSTEVNILFCLDYNQRTIWAAQPTEIEVYLKIFDVVIVQSAEDDILESSRHVSCVIHCLPDNPALPLLARLGFSFVAGHRMSVAGSFVAGGGNPRTLIHKLNLDPRIFGTQRYMVGHSDLGPVAGG